MKLRIGIIGTRGIPNHYGGFECFAENVAPLLVEKGYEVYVYNSHNHPYTEKVYHGVHIIHCYDPEYLLGTAGQFIYDLNCIRDAGKRDFDVLLFLGYTSSSVWGMFYPKGAIIVSNMDGLEWMRTKYSALTQKFLRCAEWLAIKCSHYFVADSTYIQQYLHDKYKVNATYIAYGATVYRQPDPQVPAIYGLKPYAYNMLMARMEPENNIEMILDGYLLSSSPLDFLVVGNTQNRFGRFLKEKFGRDARIKFAEAIFDRHQVSSLIYHSNIYFHGHSVGGTNPSLLEAMGSQGLIVAWDNVFNKAVLKQDGYYFRSAAEAGIHASTLHKGADNVAFRIANVQKIECQYNWDMITDRYESFFLKSLADRQVRKQSSYSTSAPAR